MANGRVRVQLAGARSFYGRFIELQRRAGNGRWQTVLRKRLSPASIAVLAPSLPESTIRVAMSVNQAGAGYLGAASHAVTYRPRRLTIEPASFKVLYGHHVALSGRLLNGGAGTRVAILAHPYGHSAPVRVASVTTRAGGRYSLFTQPKIQTTYVARLADGNTSKPVVVGVRPAMSVHELHNGNLRVHVAAAVPLRGRQVELQRLAGGRWHTIAKLPLHRKSAVFTSTLAPRSTIRVAMSVNQAGVGYLGTSSHPLLYRAA
jgi:hypothetical protein